MPSVPGYTDPTDDLLACAALEPGLRSLLLFTDSPLVLRATAKRAAEFISVVSGRKTSFITLNYSDSEDRLWGSQLPRRGGTGLRLRWRPGPLLQGGKNRPRVLLIPDLANISLALARACISLMDAEAATLQRNGQNRAWVPNLCWIAGCTRARIGEISPHLLDRFALRLAEYRLGTPEREEDIWRFANGIAQPDREMQETIPEDLKERLLMAARRQPGLSAGVGSAVLSVSKGNSSQGMRRDLALARLARGLARWNGAVTVGLEDVKRATEMLDIAPATSRIPTHDEKAKLDRELPRSVEPSREQDLSAPAAVQLPSADTEPAGSGAMEPILQGDTEMAYPATAVQPSAYPEDTAPAWRPMESLKLPPQRSGTSRSTEGPAIGTQLAIALRDIAFVSTILEAAKYQNIRGIEPADFRIERGDLRSYRRAPTPQEIFVCLIDYTSARDCEWEESLLPHLRWAYTSRAAVSVVQVGAANASEPLRAWQVNARSLLSPAIAAALDQVGGNATPLAHGLQLALKTLHAALERGRSRALEARFVVLSDGRGNVPLEASHRGEINLPVGTRGVDDAIDIARELGSLNNVQSFYLDPQPQQYSDLPVKLAHLLGAELQPVPARKLEVPGA